MQIWGSLDEWFYFEIRGGNFYFEIRGGNSLSSEVAINMCSKKNLFWKIS